MFSFDCLKPEEKQWTIILGRIGVAAYLCAEQILAVVDSVDLVAELATKSGQRRMEGVTSCLRKVGSCVLAEHDRTSVETFDYEKGVDMAAYCAEHLKQRGLSRLSVIVRGSSWVMFSYSRYLGVSFR